MFLTETIPPRFFKHHLVTPLDSVWHQKFRETDLEKKNHDAKRFSPPKCFVQISKHVITSPNMNMLRLKNIDVQKGNLLLKESSFSGEADLKRFQTVRLACWKWRLSNQTIRCLTFGDKRKILETFWSLYGVCQTFLGNPSFFSHQKKNNKPNIIPQQYLHLFTTPHPRSESIITAARSMLLFTQVSVKTWPRQHSREGDTRQPWKWHSHFAENPPKWNCSPTKERFSHLPSSFEFSGANLLAICCKVRVHI